MALVTKKYIQQVKQLLPDYAHKYGKSDSTLVSQIGECLSDRQEKTFGSQCESPNDLLKNFFTKGYMISIEPVDYSHGSFIGKWSYKNYTPNKKIPDTKGYLIDKGMLITYDKKRYQAYLKNHQDSDASIL